MYQLSMYTQTSVTVYQSSPMIIMVQWSFSDHSEPGIGSLATAWSRSTDPEYLPTINSSHILAVQLPAAHLNCYNDWVSTVHNSISYIIAISGIILDST